MLAVRQIVGEIVSTNERRTLADLVRLRHIRDLLGPRAEDAALVLFSRTGFDGNVREAGECGKVTLVSLADMYRRTS